MNAQIVKQPTEALIRSIRHAEFDRARRKKPSIDEIRETKRVMSGRFNRIKGLDRLVK